MKAKGEKRGRAWIRGRQNRDSATEGPGRSVLDPEEEEEAVTTTAADAAVLQ